jgi:hypothetical protein
MSILGRTAHEAGAFLLFVIEVWALALLALLMVLVVISPVYLLIYAAGWLDPL